MNSLLITLFISILITCAGGSLTLPLLFELFMGSLAILATGFSLFTVVKVKDLYCKNLLYLITGTLVSSLFIYFISMVLKTSAEYAFLYFSAGIFSYILIFHFKNFVQNVLLNYQVTDLLILASLIGFTLLWCWQISASFPTLVNQGVLSTWIDAYYHGSQIAQFSDIKAIGNGDIFLAGVSPLPYHRAIYLLAAAIASIANLPGLAAATALLLPIGFLLLATTIYCAGTQLAGRMAGILAVIFLLVLPDNSWLGLGNGFLGFRYVIQVAPGTAYGLAGCLISFVFFMQWLRDKATPTLLLSLFFAGAVYFFRAHFFVLYSPVLIASILYATYSEKKYFWPVTGVLFVCALCLMCLFAAKYSVVITFLKLVHLERGATVYTNFYKYISELNQPLLMIVTGIPLLLGGILGIWMIIYPVLLGIKIRRFGWEVLDVVPLILLLCYIGLVLFAPTAYQMPDELQHRPSGLLYAILIIYSLCYAVKIIASYKEKILFRYMQPVFVMGVAFGIILSVLHPHNYPLHVLFRGYSLFQDYQIPLNRDITQVAMFLRQKAVPGEIFLTSKDDTDDRYVDSAVVVSSISGMPSYLGEQTIQMLRAESARLSIIRYRDSVVRQSITNSLTRDEALNRMRANHIAWFIALSYPKWDKLGKASELSAGPMALYHA